MPAPRSRWIASPMPRWLRDFEVPEEEWGDGGGLVDPDGNEFCVV